jgi:hypothetical protein
MRRVTFYLDDEDYRKLRAVLAMQGQSASDWAREAIAKYILSNSSGTFRAEQLKNTPTITWSKTPIKAPEYFDPDVDLI